VGSPRRAFPSFYVGSCVPDFQIHLFSVAAVCSCFPDPGVFYFDRSAVLRA
jgi:hypothetical protein